MNELCTLQYTGTTKLSPNLNYIRCSAPSHTKFAHTRYQEGGCESVRERVTRLRRKEVMRPVGFLPPPPIYARIGYTHTARLQSAPGQRAVLPLPSTGRIPVFHTPRAPSPFPLSPLPSFAVKNKKIYLFKSVKQM